VVWLLWLYAALWLFLMGAVLAAEVARARRRGRRAAAGATAATTTHGDVD